MEITIYHNPRCSKSRQALDLLRERGFEPRIVEYLKTPPSADDLRRLLAATGLKPRELMRRKEPEYAEQNLDDPALSDDDLIAAIVRTPKLLERPVVVAGTRAALGRPVENILKIL